MLQATVRDLSSACQAEAPSQEGPSDPQAEPGEPGEPGKLGEGQGEPEMPVPLRKRKRKRPQRKRGLAATTNDWTGEPLQAWSSWLQLLQGTRGSETSEP